MKRLCAAIGLVLLSAQHAQPYCAKPSASLFFDFPEPPTVRPTAPYCLLDFKYSGTHSCDEWEIDAYLNELETYRLRLVRYLNDVQEFVNTTDEMADQARRFADCSMKEALSEVE